MSLQLESAHVDPCSEDSLGSDSERFRHPPYDQCSHVEQVFSARAQVPETRSWPDLAGSRVRATRIAHVLA